MEEVQGLGNIVRGSGGFGSIGVKSENDNGQDSGKKETNGQNEQTEEKKESEVKNETLKGRISGNKTRTERKMKT